MEVQGNTILITGGGSGIGRGLAEAFHGRGNQVVIAGRRRAALDEVTAANPGMKSATLDIDDPGEIARFGERMAAEFPRLNVVIHNAGIMRSEDLLDPPGYLDDAAAMITTNLLGTIRLNAAILPLLRRQERSTIMTVSSGLAFVPLAMTPTYSATKAAIHSYTVSLRYQLEGTTTEVLELIPPYVQTHLTGDRQASDPRAMPLDRFIVEVMSTLEDQPEAAEIVVERCLPLRFAETDKVDAVFLNLNESMKSRDF